MIYALTMLMYIIIRFAIIIKVNIEPGTSESGVSQ